VSHAEIIARLDDIQNEFLSFDPSQGHAGIGNGFRPTSTPPDVRIARAVYWIEKLKAELRGEAGQATP
jgi:hypothetical protein